MIFNALESKDIRKIVDIELSKLTKRIDNLGYKIEISNSAKDFIVEKGFDRKYGARPLNRAIQKYIEDLLAENVVTNKIKEGDKLLIDKIKEKKELNIITQNQKAQTKK